MKLKLSKSETHYVAECIKSITIQNLHFAESSTLLKILKMPDQKIVGKFLKEAEVATNDIKGIRILDGIVGAIYKTFMRQIKMLKYKYAENKKVMGQLESIEQEFMSTYADYKKMTGRYGWQKFKDRIVHMTRILGKLVHFWRFSALATLGFLTIALTIHFFAITMFTVCFSLGIVGLIAVGGAVFINSIAELDRQYQNIYSDRGVNTGSLKNAAMKMAGITKRLVGMSKDPEEKQKNMEKVSDLEHRINV